MRICDKDFYYGVVLNQLAIHPTFTSINKVGLNDGLYQINDMTRILIKYSASDENWRFKFTANDFDDIEQERFFHLFIVLSIFNLYFYLVFVSTTIEANGKTRIINLAFYHPVSVF